MPRKSNTEPHPNRFAYYLRVRGLTRKDIREDGTEREHFRAWAREVQQRLAVKALNQLTASILNRQ